MASAKRLLQEAYRMWFIGLTFNVIAGMYSLWQIRQKEQNIDKNEGEGVVESKKLVKYTKTPQKLDQQSNKPTGNVPLPTFSSYPISATSRFRFLLSAGPTWMMVWLGLLGP